MFFLRRNPWHWNRETDTGNDALVRRSGSSSSFAQFQNDMDQLVNSGFLTLWPVFTGREEDKTPAEQFLTPLLDVHSDEKGYKVYVELPGVSEKDVTVELRDNNLIISGEKKSEHEQKNVEKEGEGGYHRIERSYGAFKRVLGLPEDVDVDNIKADVKDGVLNVTIPRKEVKKDVSKKIAITSA